MNQKIIEEAVNKYGTPLYLYELDRILAKISELKHIISPKANLYYSMKANPLLGICQIMQAKGCGVEVASRGELHIARKAGFSPGQILFTGPGKTQNEIEYAIDQGIKLINAESMDEIKLIHKISSYKNTTTPVAIRVNPANVYANAKIKMTGVSSQFGIEENELNEAFFDFVENLNHIRLIGIQVYTGTQILDSESIVKNTEHIIELALALSKKHRFLLHYLNLGGGFGIPYFPNEPELDVGMLTSGLQAVMQKYENELQNTEITFESGRFLMADSGVYVTKVLYTKESKGNHYLICDGGSNFHAASAFLGRFVRNNYPMYVLNKEKEEMEYTVTGPLCTPSDIIGQNVKLNHNIVTGDIIVMEQSGAYGLTHSPVGFLSHETPAELIYADQKYHVLRERKKLGQMIQNQKEFNLGDQNG